MSDFTYIPESGLSQSIRPDVLTSRFNEGYEQRVANGINNKLRTWQLMFTREKTDIYAINTFLMGKGGVTSFTWTPQDLSEVKVICREWNFNYIGGDARSLNCTFEEIAA